MYNFIKDFRRKEGCRYFVIKIIDKKYSNRLSIFAASWQFHTSNLNFKHIFEKQIDMFLFMMYNSIQTDVLQMALL